MKLIVKMTFELGGGDAGVARGDGWSEVTSDVSVDNFKRSVGLNLISSQSFIIQLLVGKVSVA